MTADDVVIRTATLADHAELASIFRRASLTNDGDRDLLLAHPEHLELGTETIAAGHTRLAAIDGRTVGFATATPAGASAELDDLFVDPDWMRRGVANRLIEDAVDRARAAGCDRLEVTANGHAMAFYLQAGFVAEGEVETALAPGTRMARPVSGGHRPG